MKKLKCQKHSDNLISIKFFFNLLQFRLARPHNFIRPNVFIYIIVFNIFHCKLKDLHD